MTNTQYTLKSEHRLRSLGKEPQDATPPGGVTGALRHHQAQALQVPAAAELPHGAPVRRGGNN